MPRLFAALDFVTNCIVGDPMDVTHTTKTLDYRDVYLRSIPEVNEYYRQNRKFRIKLQFNLFLYFSVK